MIQLDSKNSFLPVNIAVLTVSDTRTLSEDKSGSILVERLTKAGHNLAAREILKDDKKLIAKKFREWANDKNIEFILITSLKKPGKLQDGRKYFSTRAIIHGNCLEKKLKDFTTEFYDGRVKDGDFTKVNLLLKDEKESPWFEAKTPGKVNTLILTKACNIWTLKIGEKIKKFSLSNN